VRWRSAVELLRGFATARTLPWVATFLADQDQDVRNWGASLLDQLVFRRAVEPEEAEPFIAAAEGHPNPGVKRAAALIRDFVLTLH
jgi:HEAT repeat protein